MASELHQEGLLPHGLSVETLQGAYEGSLIVAGTVKHVDIKVIELHVAETGQIEQGDIKAEAVFMNGHVSGVTFQAQRFVAGAQAHLSDVSLDMGSPAGCTIHEEACLEGDVRISVARHVQPSAPHQSPLDEHSAVVSSMEAENEETSVDWSDLTPDISDSEQEADIPLG